MAAIKALQPAQLYKSSRPDDFQFETTADLAANGEIPGQARAAEAVRFGLGIEHDGYNIFALRPSGAGKQFLVEDFLKEWVPLKFPAPTHLSPQILPFQ